MADGIRARVRRRFGRAVRWVANGAWLVANLGFAATLGAAIALDPKNGALIPFALTALLVAWAVPLSAMWSAFRGRSRTGVVTSRASSSFVRTGTRVIELPNDQVRSVLRRGSTLWISMSDETLWELSDMTEAEAKALQESLPSSQGFSFRVPAQRGAFALLAFFAFSAASAFLLGASGVAVDHVAPLSVYASVVVGGWLAQRRRSQVVHVGVDGVRVDGDFVGFEELKQVVSANGRLGLVTRDGKTKQYPMRISHDMARALDELAQPGIASPPADGEAFDRRGDEPLSDWLARVRRIFDEKDFRQGVVSKDVAKDLLRSAKTPPRVRIAAAAALAASDPDQVEFVLSELSDTRTAGLARDAIAGELSDELDRV